MTVSRPTPGEMHSYGLPEANRGRETQSLIARCQPRTRDTVMARPRPTSSGRQSHASPEANLGRET
jgi:hypothetical protein